MWWVDASTTAHELNNNALATFIECVMVDAIPPYQQAGRMLATLVLVITKTMSTYNTSRPPVYDHACDT